MISFTRMPGDPLVGRRLGDFVITEPLGSGGFGLVFRASQGGVERDAVIKVLLANADKARALVRQVVPLLAGRHESCRFRCHTALDNALITAPDVRDPTLKAKLGAIAGRVL